MNFVPHITLLPHSGKKLYAKPKQVSHTQKEDVKVAGVGGLAEEQGWCGERKGAGRGNDEESSSTLSYNSF